MKKDFYLFLINSRNELVKVNNKGLDLEKVDAMTTTCKNMKELIKVINEEYESHEKINDVKEIILMEQMNDNKYIRWVGPMYSKDKDILSIDKIRIKFNKMNDDKEFVKYFLIPYKKFDSYKSYIEEIENLIPFKKEYLNSLTNFYKKISVSYKENRNIYLAMKYYELVNNKKIFISSALRQEIKEYETLHLGNEENVETILNNI